MNSNYLRRFGMSSDLKQVCYNERLQKNSTQTICTSWGELSWIKWNDGGDCELWLSPASTTSARPSPAASPPRNLPFVIHSRDQRKPTFRYIICSSVCLIDRQQRLAGLLLSARRAGDIGRWHWVARRTAANVDSVMLTPKGRGPWW